MLYHCFKTNDQTRPRRPAPRPAQLRTPATTCVRTTRVAGSVQQARWGTAASTAPAAVTVQAFLSTSRYAGRCSPGGAAPGPRAAACCSVHGVALDGLEGAEATRCQPRTKPAVLSIVFLAKKNYCRTMACTVD